MLIRTHLLITLFFALIFLSFVDNKIIFILIALAATFLPDIDSEFSKIGKFLIFRPLQLFIEHRGFFHSLTFLALAVIPLIIFIPPLVFPFSLGYGSHILADGLTIQGIRPFYPSRKKISWKIKTGGTSELILFIILSISDIILILSKLFNL